MRPGQQQLQLVLDDRGGVLRERRPPLQTAHTSHEWCSRGDHLPRAPDVAVEEVPLEPVREGQLGQLLGRDEAKRGQLGDATGGEDGTDEEEDEDCADQGYHRVDETRQAAEAEDVGGVGSLVPLLDAEENGRPVGAEEEEEEHETGRDG